MSIIRDECDERQTRVDGMIERFRQAQSRRLAKAATVKGDDQLVKSPGDGQAQAAVAGSTPTPAAH